MENQILNIKKSKFGVYESALASILFVIYNFLFIQLYATLPINFRANTFVSLVASFLLESLFAVAAVTVSLTRRVNFVKATGVDKKINGKIIGWGFCLSLVCLLCLGNITDLFLQILYALGYKSVLPGLEINNFGIYIGYVLVFCLTPAVCEELLFRGVVLSGFKQYGAKIAIICSAVIFTFMHGNAEQTVHQFLIGAIVGFIFYETGNLWLGVIVHFFNNFISVTASFLLSIMGNGSSSAATTTSLTMFDLVYSIIYAVIFAYIGYYLIRLIIAKMFVENEKLNGKVNENTQNAQLQTITIDGEESVVEMTIDGEPQTGVQEGGETNSENVKSEDKQKMSVGEIIMFTIAGLFMAFDWISSLLIGFGV